MLQIYKTAYMAHFYFILTGEKSIEEVGEEVFEKSIQVLNGEMTKNEAIQYFTSIDIFCLGPVI